VKSTGDISEQNGFRKFIVVLLAAILMGSLVRASLAPDKIEHLIRGQLEATPLGEQLAFTTAEISLADGWLPDFALVLQKIELRASPTCPGVAPIRAQSIRIPLRWLSLLKGTPAAGQITVDDLTLDLDELKRRCDADGKTLKAGAAPSSSPVLEVIQEISRATKEIPESGALAAPSEPSEQEIKEVVTFVSERELESASKLIRGLRVTRAEVFFEDRMKSVVLENMSLKWVSAARDEAGNKGRAIQASMRMKFPPSTVFGETLPAFGIQGTIGKESIQASVRADLNEGALEGHLSFKPLMVNGGKELDTDLRVSVRSLPLSVMTPLLVKSGIVEGAFRPRFVWLDCQAHMRGIFSRLLINHPIELGACEVSGQVGKLRVDKATRLPSGLWEPFEVQADNVDIARVLEAFELAGPSGVFSNFGRLNGVLRLNSPRDLHAKGRVDGAVVRFAGGEGIALQPVAVGKIEAKLGDGKWKIDLQEFSPDGGGANLGITAVLNASGHTGQIDVVLKSLKLGPRVEKVIFTGAVDDISGKARLELADGKLARLKADLALKMMRGSEAAADEVSVEASLVKAKGALKDTVEIFGKSERVEVFKSSHLYRLLQPLLLGWQGEQTEDGQKLVLKRMGIRGRFLSEGFRWTQATAQVGVAKVESQGILLRDHVIEAKLGVDYPLAKGLKWDVSGTWMRPRFATGSPELTALYAKAGLPEGTVTGSVSQRILGIPTADAATKEPAKAPAPKSLN
jgi:hypothetical protein